MHTRIFFLTILLTSLSACKSLAPRFEYQGEPHNYAWYLRTHIEPLAAKVAGIPVRRFNPDWCFANELRAKEFPVELAEKLAVDRKSQLDRGYTQVDFKLYKPFGLQGPDYISIGTFRNCVTNEYGTFVFAMKHGKLLDVLRFGPSSFGMLSMLDLANQPHHNDKAGQAAPKPPELGVFWQECFECDVVARITWDAAQARFGETQSLMPSED